MNRTVMLDQLGLRAFVQQEGLPDGPQVEIVCAEVEMEVRLSLHPPAVPRVGSVRERWLPLQGKRLSRLTTLLGTAVR
jgi:hypothetical protein